MNDRCLCAYGQVDWRKRERKIHVFRAFVGTKNLTESGARRRFPSPKRQGSKNSIRSKSTPNDKNKLFKETNKTTNKLRSNTINTASSLNAVKEIAVVLFSLVIRHHSYQDPPRRSANLKHTHVWLYAATHPHNARQKRFPLIEHALRCVRARPAQSQTTSIQTARPLFHSFLPHTRLLVYVPQNSEARVVSQKICI